MYDQANIRAHPGNTETSVGLGESRPMFIMLGLLLILLGVIATGAPLAATIVAEIFAGWLLLVSGIAYVIAVAAGALLVLGLSSTTMWAIGLVVGVDILIWGSSSLAWV